MVIVPELPDKDDLAPQAPCPFVAAMLERTAGLRIAIIHEWLVSYAGSERVLEAILGLFPQADLFSLVDFLPDDERGFIGGRQARSSFIQKLPFARRHFRKYLPLFPLAIQQHDLSGYDLVISSSHAVAKGVITGGDQRHLCYCHSPMRYAWDMQFQYLQEAGLEHGIKSWLARRWLHGLRLWDTGSSGLVDRYLANSAFTAGRITKFYRRAATVVYPPVAVEQFAPASERQDYYVIVSRLVPYKRVPLIARAFRQRPERRLIIIGDGPELAAVKAEAAEAANITLLGYQPTEIVHHHVASARGFIYAAAEDFGIAMVEAQAAGTPVIAFERGGALEIVRTGAEPTGLFFAEQTAESLNEALDRFEAMPAISAAACRANAQRFSLAVFRSRFAETLLDLLNRAGPNLDTALPTLWPTA